MQEYSQMHSHTYINIYMDKYKLIYNSKNEFDLHWILINYNYAYQNGCSSKQISRVGRFTSQSGHNFNK